MNEHHLPNIPQLPALPVQSGAGVTCARCTHLKSPWLGQSSYLCFCTLGPTCNSCAKVPSSSSQTLPITAGPTAYIKGLKQKATKSPTHEIQKPLPPKPCHFGWSSSPGHNTVAGWWGTNRILAGSFTCHYKVIYPKTRNLQHILHLSLHTLRLICSLAWENSSTVRQLYNWGWDKITVLTATQPTKMLPTKHAASRIAYSPTDSLLP